MESERILRTSFFGGFRREDVLKYVEELKGEIAAMAEELKAKTEQLSELTGKVETLSSACEQAKETEQKLAETTTALLAAEAKNVALQAENAALTERFAAIDREKAGMEKKAEEIRASEAQLGAAFLDARKYSDEIVTAANKKAGETQLDASDSIAKQAEEVSRLSADVDALAATLNKSIDDLHADISALSAKLSKAAQALKNRKDAEKFVPDMSIKIADELVEKAMHAEDGGVTFLRYSQHTDSNADTSGKPNAVYRFDTPKEG